MGSKDEMRVVRNVGEACETWVKVLRLQYISELRISIGGRIWGSRKKDISWREDLWSLRGLTQTVRGYTASPRPIPFIVVPDPCLISISTGLLIDYLWACL